MKRKSLAAAIFFALIVTSCTKDAGPDIMIDGAPRRVSQKAKTINEGIPVRLGTFPTVDANGSPYDPNGSPKTEAGNLMDPNGKPANKVESDHGLLMDPDGRK